MIQEAPIHVLNGLQKLVPKNLEKKLFEQEKLFFSSGQWSEQSKRVGIFFDLSQLRWVSLGAAAQLVLLIENAKKENVQVYVALPLRRLTKREKSSSDYNPFIRENIRKVREEVNLFLKIIQFDRAIKCGHIKNKKDIKITEEFDFLDKKLGLDLHSFNEAFQKEYKISNYNVDYSRFNYKYIFPFTWVNSKKEAIQLEEFEKKFQFILADSERGLSNIDVLSLKNVIISELLKNVDQHAGNDSKYALIVLGLMATTTLIHPEEDELISYSNQMEDEYLTWLYSNSVQNFIEIYIGDSGTGIISNDLRKNYYEYNKTSTREKSNFEDFDVLKWAFNKWSTSKRNEIIRGTKGLYRINRIVNKYNGIFLIRSKNLHGGFQKGNYSPAKWVDNRNLNCFNQPGTLIQLKLCPYTEIKKYNFSFKKTGDKLSWSTLRYEITNSSIKNFDTWIKSQNDLRSESNLLIIFQSIESISLKLKSNFFGNCFKQLSYIRHPNGIVVYIADEIGRDLLEEIIHSTNELIVRDMVESVQQESTSPDQERVYDPILIIEKGNNVFWCGENQKIIDILNEIYVDNINVVNLQELNNFQKLSEDEKSEVGMYFRNDDSLVTISENFEIEFNFTNIPIFFRDSIKYHLSEQGENKIVCTPKLKIVEKWHEIKEILSSKEVVGYALAMFLKLLENFKGYKCSSSTHILIDHNQQYELASEFAKITGIAKENIISIIDDIDNSIPRRTVLFNKGDEVIVLTTIISSSETIRRLVKFAKRDQAIPKCIICLANFREYNIEKLQTWGKDTPILSLFQYKIEDSKEKPDKLFGMLHYDEIYRKLNQAVNFRSPDYEPEDFVSNKDLISQLEVPTDLKTHLVSTKSFHYNHYGKYSGRHFTFYLDKLKILQNESLIWKKFRDEIQNWIDSHHVESFVLVKPDFNRDSNYVFDNCILYLQQKLNISEVVNFNTELFKKINSKNIVFIDFGSLTGNSINNLLSFVKNVDSVFVCILFSQFQNNEAEFYKRIKTIEVDSLLINDKGKSIQTELFADNSNIIAKLIPKTVNVEIRFIYNFPLKYYSSTTCPICEHERALELHKIADEYMIDYSSDRKRKLKIKSKKDIGLFPTDFYIVQNDDISYELSSIIIMKMYELELLLNKALSHTQFRKILFYYIFKILEKINKEISNPNSNLYAFLYLISNEIIWMQKEPLIFRDFRHMISEISLVVATKDIQELVVEFDKSVDAFNHDSFNIATRYKYAAITVLRSANKFLFCENFSKIIFTSIRNEKLSDNLFQNCLNHINSLHNNKYNESSKYYVKLSEEFNRIRSGNIDLSFKQKMSLYFIQTNNERIKRSLEWDENNVNSTINVLKSLIDEVYTEYHGISHPQPAKLFENLNFRSLGYNENAWLDFKEKKEESVFFEEFTRKREMLVEDWLVSMNFIETKIKPFIQKLNGNILQSELFKTFGLDCCKYDDIKNKFTRLIKSINDNILNLISYYEVYHSYYDFIYKLYISYEKESRAISENSQLLSILRNLDTDLIKCINTNFSSIKFKKVDIKSDKTQCKIFYSYRELNYYFKHIFDNIFFKKNSDVSLEDISINFEIHFINEYTVLEITYDKAFQCKDYHENGGLALFKEDLIRYGGTLEHGLREDNIYQIRIKTLTYD